MARKGVSMVLSDCVKVTHRRTCYNR